MLTVDAFLSRLDGVKTAGNNQWMARCPCHDDKKQSLAISIGSDGRILLNDHGGCDTNKILQYCGLDFADISPDKKPQVSGFDWQNIVARYDYRNGNRKLRDPRKNFAWQHQEGGEWKPRRNNAPPCLFASGSEQTTIFVVEGEKDAVNLSKCGLYCVSPENGATQSNFSKKWCAEYTEELSGKDVRIIPDNDEVGHIFAAHIAAQLVSVASSVKLFDLSTVWPDIPAKGDISDAISTLGEEKALQLLSQLEANTKLFAPQNAIELEVSAKGTPLQTAGNYLAILRGDEYFSTVRFNMLRGFPERIIGHQRIQWTDADDAKARNYIEGKYHISNRYKYEDAFAEFQHEREYHPVHDAIESVVWDGTHRCTTFLITWAGAEDTPYNREVSRLIFAGGINRIYNPGCRFDEVAVLIGNQGGGKSTLCQWLALDADFYAALKTIAGQKGNEGIQGKWIIELEELLAFIANDRSGTRTEENAKAFLSGKSDYYRMPYARRPTDNPRQCIFIGTTNQAEFLTDKTGNRRWYPVVCHQTAENLYSHQNECKHDISQAWAEMLAAFRNGDELANPYASKKLLGEIKAAQKSAEIDDWRIGAIGDFLEGKRVVCLKQIWDSALHNGNSFARSMERRDSRELANILTHTFGWVLGKSTRFDGYGVQRAYHRPGGLELPDELLIP